jgi:hypothetical protein
LLKTDKLILKENVYENARVKNIQDNLFWSCFFFAVLGIEPRALCMLGKQPLTYIPSPLKTILKNSYTPRHMVHICNPSTWEAEA